MNSLLIFASLVALANGECGWTAKDKFLIQRYHLGSDSLGNGMVKVQRGVNSSKKADDDQSEEEHLKIFRFFLSVSASHDRF